VLSSDHLSVAQVQQAGDASLSTFQLCRV